MSVPESCAVPGLVRECQCRITIRVQRQSYRRAAKHLPAPDFRRVPSPTRPREDGRPTKGAPSDPTPRRVDLDECVPLVGDGDVKSVVRPEVRDRIHHRLHVIRVAPQAVLLRRRNSPFDVERVKPVLILDLEAVVALNRDGEPRLLAWLGGGRHIDVAQDVLVVHCSVPALHHLEAH